MFMGVTAHQSVKRVASYADAQAVFEKFSKTPTGKQRKEQTNGFHLSMSSNHGVTWVRERADQAIAFQLYDTDVVAWYPDNSVVVCNYGSVTTSRFASRFLPGGIWLNHPTTRHGVEGGHRTISFRSEMVQSHWEHRTCCGSHVRFVHDTKADAWLPDETTLDEMHFPVLDQRAAREISREYSLRDFDMWLSMAPRHMQIEHDSWSLYDCATALKKRDFVLASMFLPLIEDTGAFGNTIRPLPIHVSRYRRYVTMGSLARLRTALYDDEGAYTTVTHKHLPHSQFDKLMTKVRELDRLGCGGSYGPQR